MYTTHMYGRLQGRTGEDRSSFLVGATNTTKNNSKTQMQMHFSLPPSLRLPARPVHRRAAAASLYVCVCVLYPYLIS